MLFVKEETTEGFPTVCIYQADKQVVQILKSGATLNVLGFPTEYSISYVIQGYDLKPGMEIASSKSALLFPFPNRLEGGLYTYGDQEYQFPINEPERNNAIHGFLKDREFTLKDNSISGDTAELIFSYEYDGSEPFYPFAFTFEVSYKYSPTQLETSFHVKNTGDGSMPFGFGWHPYFTIKKEKVDDMKLSFRKCDLVEVNENMIPTGQKMPYSQFDAYHLIGKEELDTCFDMGKQYVVNLKSYTKHQKLKISTSKSFTFLQLYIPPDRKTIAVEPMTCNVNVFNNKDGLLELKEGDTFSCSCKIELIET
ncbi:MAG: hypothetical protein KI790_18185 [Cyclobacteriaceae bacterium]|nr:hypothetical protein [Cyclobacteriaceae bacterium HetDA_MAG_MS6]